MPSTHLKFAEPKCEWYRNIISAYVSLNQGDFKLSQINWYHVERKDRLRDDWHYKNRHIVLHCDNEASNHHKKEKKSWQEQGELIPRIWLPFDNPGSTFPNPRAMLRTQATRAFWPLHTLLLCNLALHFNPAPLGCCCRYPGMESNFCKLENEHGMVVALAIARPHPATAIIAPDTQLQSQTSQPTYNSFANHPNSRNVVIKSTNPVRYWNPSQRANPFFFPWSSMAMSDGMIQNLIAPEEQPHLQDDYILGWPDLQKG